MRIVTLGFALLVVCSGAIAQFPQGTFRGEGKMTSKTGVGGAYTSELVLAGNEMTATYTHGAQTFTYRAKFTFEKNGFLLLEEHGKPIGSGYCLDNMCRLDLRAHKAEETLTFVGDSIYRIGSKDYPMGKLIYTEKLERHPSTR